MYTWYVVFDRGFSQTTPMWSSGAGHTLAQSVRQRWKTAHGHRCLGSALCGCVRQASCTTLVLDSACRALHRRCCSVGACAWGHRSTLHRVCWRQTTAMKQLQWTPSRCVGGVCFNKHWLSNSAQVLVMNTTVPESSGILRFSAPAMTPEQQSFQQARRNAQARAASGKKTKSLKRAWRAQLPASVEGTEAVVEEEPDDEGTKPN